MEALLASIMVLSIGQLFFSSFEFWKYEIQQGIEHVFTFTISKFIRTASFLLTQLSISFSTFFLIINFILIRDYHIYGFYYWDIELFDNFRYIIITFITSFIFLIFNVLYEYLKTIYIRRQLYHLDITLH